MISSIKTVFFSCIFSCTQFTEFNTLWSMIACNYLVKMRISPRTLKTVSTNYPRGEYVNHFNAILHQQYPDSVKANSWIILNRWIDWLLNNFYIFRYKRCAISSQLRCMCVSSFQLVLLLEQLISFNFLVTIIASAGSSLIFSFYKQYQFWVGVAIRSRKIFSLCLSLSVKYICKIWFSAQVRPK